MSKIEKIEILKIDKIYKYSWKSTLWTWNKLIQSQGNFRNTIKHCLVLIFDKHYPHPNSKTTLDGID